jgi:thiol-disulfide isomerase/thioredoxin
MTKQKLMSLFSLLGFIFIIVLGVGYFQQYKTRGEVITKQIEVPASFARQFNRVIKKNRARSIPSTPFMAPDGEQVDWPDFEGRYTLVNFWATWCAPCVIELPSLDKLQKKYEGRGLNVISVSLDTMRGHDYISRFLDNRNIGTFAAYLDVEQNIQKTVSMRGIPTTYLLDKQGNIINIFEGDANWVSPGALKFFDMILKVSKE